ncbi:MAG: bifunctional UDP-sugar hydrolase/5'-nucleotidase [Polyangiaceae bacterium]
MGKGWLGGLGVASLLLACGAEHDPGPRWKSAVRVVLLHTADLHSHVFPEPTLISAADARRGLGHAREVEAIGGVARIATLVSGIRSTEPHTLYLDSGDLIEGTDAFTAFGGEPEMRAFSALHVAAVALGNHDLGPGVPDFLAKHHEFARFPVLAANYAAPNSGLGSALAPYVVLNAGGVRVGVIGVANPDSPGGLAAIDNPYGISLTPVAEAVQSAIDAVRPSVDLVVALTHLGLSGDEAMIRATSGLDVVLGGHQHLTLDEPLARFDCGPALRAERACHERRVFVVHSGAYGRYVGRVELLLSPAAAGADPADGLEVVTATHALLPVSAAVTDDGALSALLEPYRARLAAAGFDAPVAFATGPLPRYGATGGDSPLGDLIADAIRVRAGAELALLNTTGIRADLPPGVLAKSSFAAALPFGDTLTVLRLSGTQLSTLFEKQAQLASARECQSPFQGSGFSVTLSCRPHTASHARQLSVAGRAVDPAATYSLVTTDYLADNGSGFDVPPSRRTALVGEADPLELVLDAIRQLPVCGTPPLPCLDPRRLLDGRITVSAQ